MGKRHKGFICKNFMAGNVQGPAKCYEDGLACHRSNVAAYERIPRSECVRGELLLTHDEAHGPDGGRGTSSLKPTGLARAHHGLANGRRSQPMSDADTCQNGDFADECFVLSTRIDEGPAAAFAA
eukprot:scaffold155343_cov29-Tisochrysis_lutea.AAC.1